MVDCFICKGKYPRIYCGREFCPIYQKFSGGIRKVGLDFSGTSPPDIFVGRANYPNVFTGILSPVGHVEDSARLSSPEEWFARGMGIDDILACRGSLIYSRFVTDVHSKNNRLTEAMQQVSMAKKSFDMEFHLKKKPAVRMEMDRVASPIGNAAPLKQVLITENPKISRRVDYVVSDNDMKAVDAVMDLYSQGETDISNLIRLLSAGLLGLKPQRKLTPSRWAITAVDSMISGELTGRIKKYPWINDYSVFSEEYVGNHYEFILMPMAFSFEVIEAKMGGSVWNPQDRENIFMQDYEGVYGRKTYASEVSGGYYAVRLAVSEYLERIRRQAGVLVLREVKSEYYAPLGVGILREVGRSCFRKRGERFGNLNDALKSAGARMKIPVEEFIKRSKIIRELNEQSTLHRWI